MANANTMTVTIKLAVKSTQEWAALAHAPAKGCPCVEVTGSGDVKLKIGNGVDLFPDLKYVLGGGSSDMPMASATVLGGIKLSEDLHIDENGVVTIPALGDVSAALDTINGEVI